MGERKLGNLATSHILQCCIWAYVKVFVLYTVSSQ